MSETKKRPWFQFHLSTLVVLTLVAGGLVLLNMTEDHYEWEEPEPSVTPVLPLDYGLLEHGVRYGWPWVAYDRCPDSFGESAGAYSVTKFDGQIQKMGLLADILFTAFILVSVGVLCEMIIRRNKREAKGDA